MVHREESALENIVELCQWSSCTPVKESCDEYDPSGFTGSQLSFFFQDGLVVFSLLCQCHNPCGCVLHKLKTVQSLTCGPTVPDLWSHSQTPIAICSNLALMRTIQQWLKWLLSKSETVIVFPWDEDESSIMYLQCNVVLESMTSTVAGKDLWLHNTVRCHSLLHRWSWQRLWTAKSWIHKEWPVLSSVVMVLLFSVLTSIPYAVALSTRSWSSPLLQAVRLMLSANHRLHLGLPSMEMDLLWPWTVSSMIFSWNTYVWLESEICLDDVLHFGLDLSWCEESPVWVQMPFVRKTVPLWDSGKDLVQWCNLQPVLNHLTIALVSKWPQSSTQMSLCHIVKCLNIHSFSTRREICVQMPLPDMFLFLLFYSSACSDHCYAAGDGNFRVLSHVCPSLWSVRSGLAVRIGRSGFAWAGPLDLYGKE